MNETPDEGTTVLAKEGTVLSSNTRNTLTLRLFDGTIHSIDARAESYQRTDFATYDFSIDIDETLEDIGPQEKEAQEMTAYELQQSIAEIETAGDRAYEERVELQRKYSIPFACLVFAGIAIPLGIRPARSVRARGFGLSLAVILLYYVFLTLGESLAVEGKLPATIAMWLPNVAMAAIAAFLFVSAARETTSEQSSFYERKLGPILQRLSNYFRRGNAGNK